MGFKSAVAESFYSNGEDIAAAGASALGRVRALADIAPKGRFFTAIATLSELSATTTQALEQGDLTKAQHVAARLTKASIVKLQT